MSDRAYRSNRLPFCRASMIVTTWVSLSAAQEKEAAAPMFRSGTIYLIKVAEGSRLWTMAL